MTGKHLDTPGGPIYPPDYAALLERIAIALERIYAILERIHGRLGAL